MKARSEVLASPQTFKLQDFLTSFLSSQPHAWNCQGSWRQLCSTVWISPLSPLVHNPKVHLISVYVLYEASSKFACLHLATQQVCPLFPFPTAQLTCLNIPPAPALPKFCHPTALPCRLGDLLAASTTFPASVIFMPWFAFTLSSGCCAPSHINQWLWCTPWSFALLKQSTLSERLWFFLH